MTVFEEFFVMVSTGFTGVPLIVGTHLANIMEEVTKDLESREDVVGEGPIRLDANWDYYSGYFYYLVWGSIIQPIVVEYLHKKAPNSWVIPHYNFKYHD